MNQHLCPICGSGLPTTAHNRVYCSLRCRKKAERTKEMQRLNAERMADGPVGLVTVEPYITAEGLDRWAEALVATAQPIPIYFVHPDPLWENPTEIIWTQDAKTNLWVMMAR